MLPDSIRCADSMMFFGKPGDPPIFTEQPKNVLLGHLTSVRPWITDFSEVLKEHIRFVYDTLSNENILTILNGKDARDIHERKRVGVLFGMQHAPSKMDIKKMRTLHTLGLRVMAIAYDGLNEYGCGYMDSSSGLTSKGQELIVDMTECGIILDVSHASHKTAIDALNFIRKE